MTDNPTLKGITVTNLALAAALAATGLLGLAAPAVAAPAEHVPGPPGGTDGRKYEQVTPAYKAGYSFGTNTDGAAHLGVAPDGSRVSYDGTYPLPGSESGSWAGFLSVRSSSGWGSWGLPKTHGPNQSGSGAPASTDAVLRGTSADQRVSVYWDCTSAPYGALWVRREDGSRVRIADATGWPLANACLGRAALQPWFLGISADGSRVVFNSTSRLGPAAALAPGSNRILYEWVDDGANGGAGTLHVVNRTNDEPLALLAASNASLGGTVPVATGGVSPRDFDGFRNAISDGSDGHRRVFFQNPAPASPTAGGGTLYARTDSQTTTVISAPVAGYTPVSAPTATGVKYLDASRDGRRVFFYADGDLTPDAPAGGGIYQYDVDPDGAGPSTSRLTFVDEALDGGATTGLADADGSHFYYVRDGSFGGIYLYSGGQTAAVGAYVSGGRAHNLPARVGFDAVQGFRTAGCVTADVSDDGRYLAFSGTSLDTAGQTRQVYRFDAEGNGGAGVLELVSTSPRAPGRSDYESGFSGECDAGWGRPVEKRFMSADGRTILFDTGAALVDGDVNGPFGLDSYRWRDGEVGLISSGTAAGYSSSLGLDATGANAFFSTLQPLVAQDGDEAFDLYDARIGGGFPVAVVAPPCVGDDCQGPHGRPPAAAALGTMAALGAGNARSAGPGKRCARVRKRASRLSRHGRRLARRAKRIQRRVPPASRRAKRLAAKSGRVQRKARRLNRQAKRCRRSGR